MATCVPYISGAESIAAEQFDIINGHTTQTLDAALVALDNLQHFAIPQVTVNVDFNDAPNIPIQQIGPKPDLETINLVPQVNDVPEPEDVTVPALVLPSGEPVAPPEAPPPLFPADPVLEDPSMPTEPTITLPTELPVMGDQTSEIPFPELRDIVLPEPPVLALDEITFDAQPPEFTGTDPDPADFAYIEDEYEPLILEQVRTKLLEILAGGTGLPAAVENALFERARERENEMIVRAVDEARDEWAGRGFMYPGGPLDKRVQRARHDGQQKISQLNRDQFIEAWKIEIEQLRFAITNGIALEDLWIRKFISTQDRKLQAARFAVDLAISIYNAQVARYNAEAQVYLAQAQVYRERIQAELAKVQVYSEQIRAQQLIGELNEQDVRIYAERLKAVLVDVEIYKAMLDGYRAQIEGERAKVDVYKAQLEAVNTLLQANSLEVQVFIEKIRAENTKIEAYKARADVYGTQVQAWSTKYNAAIAGQQAEIERARLQIQQFESLVQAYRALLDKERTRIAAINTNNDSRVQLYAIEGRSVDTHNNAQAQKTLAIIEESKATADVALRNGEINISNIQNIYGLMLRAQETLATTLAQLAAGGMAAANVSANLQSGTNSSFSVNCEQT